MSILKRTETIVALVLLLIAAAVVATVFVVTNDEAVTVSDSPDITAPVVEETVDNGEDTVDTDANADNTVEGNNPTERQDAVTPTSDPATT